MWREHRGPWRLAAAAFALTLVLAPPAATEEPVPNFSGRWRMNAARSDDVRAKIEEAAGAGMVASASGPRGDWGNIKGGEGDEVERVRLREFMLEELDQARNLEIAQTASEVKIMHGDAGVRIFYFGREGVRNSASGLKLKTSVRWHGGQQLVIEQSGEDKTHVAEMYTLLPGGDQMALSFLWESRFLHAPLKLGLIFDRDKGGS